MSTLALQRALVRLLYDPALVARVHSDPAAALADARLEESERALLLAWDRRAFGTDPQRRTRTLAALMEEYPAACLSVLLAARSAAPLDAFFSSPTFHACVQQGATLALAFGEYLMGLGADWAPRRASRQGAARLEHAIAAARRSAASVANGGQPDGVGAGDRVAAPEVLPVRLRLAPGVAVVAAPAGTLAVKQAVTAALTTPVGARPGAVSDTIVELAAAGLELPELAEGDDEQLLIHAQAEAGGPAIVERIPAELARVLAAAARDVDRSVLLELLRAEGAAAGEDADVLRSLLGDKVLVAVAPDTQPAG